MVKRRNSSRTFNGHKAKPARPPRIPLDDLARFPSENPNPVLRLNRDGKILYSNKASRVILRHWRCKVGGYAPKSWREVISEVLRGRDSRTIDAEYNEKIYSFSLTPIVERGYVNIYASDITDRRLAEERLRNSEQSIRDMIENIPVGISITTPKKKVIIINRTLWEMFGFGSEETFLDAFQSPDRLFVDVKDRDHFYREMAEKGYVRNMEIRYKRKDGGVFWGSVTSISRIIEGGMVQYLNIIQDVTSHKMAEEAKLKAVNQAASSIAHDIRNPLSSIRTAAYLLRDCSEEEKLNMLKLIERNITYADMLLKNLLDFSTTLSYVFVEEDLNVLLRETLDQTNFPENVKLTAHYGKIPPIKVDKDKLTRALSNLIINAIQAMPDGGGLDISTGQMGNFVELRIIDTGVGIKRENLDRIFEPFFTTKAKGLGLGLYNVKKVIEGHGGTFILTSQEHEGSSATISLPLG
jgi:PAS domain S-box-containing protein